jgi:hypothetical protein
MSNGTIDPDILLMNPNVMTTFIKDEAVQNVLAYSDLEEEYKLLDLKVVESPMMPKGAAILIDSRRVGFNIIKRELDGYIIDKPEFDQIWYQFWWENEFVVMDTMAVGILTNLEIGTNKAGSL